jgi:ParB family chromosome partitioning protein
MTTAQPRLGRGLDALMGGTNHPTSHRLPVDRITQNPYQPRKRFDEDELNHLKESIKNHGILQPLVVRPMGEGYQLIAGERRLRAAKDVGITDVPVHVVDFSDQQTFEAALVENIQRADLNPVEKAQGFRDYLERYQMTQEQLGARLGLDRTTVSNLLGLLTLPHEVQDAVRLGQISMGHAKVIKGLPEAAKQVALCKETIMKGYSVHALEQMMKAQKKEEAEVALAKHNATHAPAETHRTPHVVHLESELKQKLACRVEIKCKAKDKGQVVISFESNDDFERILNALRK